MRKQDPFWGTAGWQAIHWVLDSVFFSKVLFPLRKMDIVNTSHSLESELSGWGNQELSAASGACTAILKLFFFFKRRFQDSLLPSLLTSKEEDSGEVTVGEEAEPRGPLLQGPFPLPGSWPCDCCLCLWCLQGKALRGGELHLGHSSPSKMNTNISCHDPPSCSTHSACLTQLAASARAQSTSASRLKCPFALGDGPGSWWAGAGGPKLLGSPAGCVWEGTCVIDTLNGFHLPFNFPLPFQKANQEFVLSCQAEWKAWLLENSPLSRCWFLQ